MNNSPLHRRKWLRASSADGPSSRGAYSGKPLRANCLQPGSILVLAPFHMHNNYRMLGETAGVMYFAQKFQVSLLIKRLTCRITHIQAPTA